MLSQKLTKLQSGRQIQKWDYYFEIYEKHFQRFIGRSPVILEIGVCDGGSLELWKTYFGTGSKVVGIDIDPRCLAFADEQIKGFYWKPNGSGIPARSDRGGRAI